MNVSTFMAILGTVALLPGVYGAYEAIRRRRIERRREHTDGDRFVVQSAMDLLKPYERRVNQLETDLKHAQDQIKVMDHELGAANRQIVKLNEQLVDANTEVQFLRLQVKTMSTHLHTEQDEGT